MQTENRLAEIMYENDHQFL